MPCGHLNPTCSIVGRDPLERRGFASYLRGQSGSPDRAKCRRTARNHVPPDRHPVQEPRRSFSFWADGMRSTKPASCSTVRPVFRLPNGAIRAADVAWLDWDAWQRSTPEQRLDAPAAPGPGAQILAFQGSLRLSTGKPPFQMLPGVGQVVRNGTAGSKIRLFTMYSGVFGGLNSCSIKGWCHTRTGAEGGHSLELEVKA